MKFIILFVFGIYSAFAITSNVPTSKPLNKWKRKAKKIAKRENIPSLSIFIQSAAVFFNFAIAIGISKDRNSIVLNIDEIKS